MISPWKKIRTASRSALALLSLLATLAMVRSFHLDDELLIVLQNTSAGISSRQGFIELQLDGGPNRHFNRCFFVTHPDPFQSISPWLFETFLFSRFDCFDRGIDCECLGFRCHLDHHAPRDIAMIQLPYWAIAIAALRLAYGPFRSPKPRPPETPRCPHCGYDTRATPLRCPECGAPLTRPDATT